MYCNIIHPLKSVSDMEFAVQLKTSNKCKFADCAILCPNRFCFKNKFYSIRIVNNFANSSEIFVEKKRSRSFSQLSYGKAKKALFYHWLLSMQCAPYRQVVITVAQGSSRTEGSFPNFLQLPQEILCVEVVRQALLSLWYEFSKDEERKRSYC